MNYGSIKIEDTANGPGLRTSLFVSGCTHHCKGCFNPETWDFSYGKPYTKEVEKYIFSTLNHKYVDGLTILGGEPMEVVNQKELYNLCFHTKCMGKSLWIYSGYTLEELMDPENKRCHGVYTESILSFADVLVDGEFQIENKDISLVFRGSRNQRIITNPVQTWRSMYEVNKLSRLQEDTEDVS